MSAFKQKWNKIPKFVQIIIYVVLGAAAVVLLGFVFGLLIQQLWNWLMPEIFGLKEITFWQAIGLFVLARFLLGFSGVGGNEDKSKSKKKKKDSEEDVLKDWKSGQYFDEWWESEGKNAFKDYADNMKDQPKGKE